MTPSLRYVDVPGWVFTILYLSRHHHKGRQKLQLFDGSMGQLHEKRPFSQNNGWLRATDVSLTILKGLVHMLIILVLHASYCS